MPSVAYLSVVYSRRAHVVPAADGGSTPPASTMTRAKHIQITIVGFTGLTAVIWAGSESSWWLLLFLIVPVALLLFSLLVWLDAWVNWKYSWANSPASGPLYKQYRRDR